MGYLIAGCATGAVTAAAYVIWGGAPVWQGLALHAGAGTATVVSMVALAFLFGERDSDEDSDGE